MRTLTDKQYNVLKSLCTLPPDKILEPILSFLKDEYDYLSIDYTKDYLYAKGTLPVMLVAHIDTVFSYAPDEIFYDKEKGAIWAPYGLGADDRAGIFGILDLVCRGFHPSILLLNGEEKGCLGAQAFIKNYPKTPKNIKYIIELDRAGTNDCVFYDCGNRDFISYIESFHFAEAQGTYTDIVVLGPQWGIATVNLSIGYEREHTYSETLYVGPMLATIERISLMLKEVSDIHVPFFKFGYKVVEISDPETQCSICKKPIDPVETFMVLRLNGKKEPLCPTCLARINVKWCDKCYEPFEFSKPDEKICSNCMNMKKVG